VRILTKNAAVVRDFDVCQQYRDRVRVGISLTATPDKEHLIKLVEPHASTISERMSDRRKTSSSRPVVATTGVPFLSECERL
jgi:DNA repair photolyase